jgi:hypothetical protein
MKDSVYDVVIIGAGAAGLMCAAICQEHMFRVLLLDGNDRPGAKILVSGGTRSNVTNEEVTEADFNTENKRSVRDVLRAFSSEQTLKFFESLGVPLVLEEDGKYFPEAQSGKAVLDGFLKKISVSENVQLKKSSKVKAVTFQNNLFHLTGPDFQYQTKCVVLATGGKSYPATGSDGTGYEIAKSFGHSLIELSPALVPLNANDTALKALSGLTLPVRLTLFLDSKKAFEREGSLLFTHTGFSGPVVLDASRHWIRNAQVGKIKLCANFLPKLKEEDLRKEINAMAHEFPKRTVRHFISGYLPEKFSCVLLGRAGISEDFILNQLHKAKRESIVRAVYHFELPVTGAMGYDKAEVTAGGVNLAEVNSKTLESKLQPGLFFAGEMLDADGRIGGFNFQWAWSSAVVAARGISAKVNLRC